MSAFTSLLRRIGVAATMVILGLPLATYSAQAQAAPLPTLTCTRPAADPEIAALARSLEYNLGLIYEYVYYNVDYSQTWGSKKGSLGTYLDKRGNNVDQNVLFVDLLRQSCITANFRYGAVAVPSAALANLLGVDNDVVTISTALGRGGYSANVTAQTTTLNMVWTEAKVGSGTYELDPSFKSFGRSTPIDLAVAMGYSKASLLSALGNTTPPVQTMQRTPPLPK